MFHDSSLLISALDADPKHGVNEPGRNLQVQIFEYTFRSGLNFKVLSAASISAYQRQTPKFRGSCCAKLCMQDFGLHKP